MVALSSRNRKIEVPVLALSSRNTATGIPVLQTVGAVMRQRSPMLCFRISPSRRPVPVMRGRQPEACEWSAVSRELSAMYGFGRAVMRARSRVACDRSSVMWFPALAVRRRLR